MLKISREYVTYSMSAQDKPAGYMEPGELVEFETYDCYQGQILKEGTTFADRNPALANPATGPVFVNGAKPGDTLKITIRKLEMGKIGILDVGPNSGAMKGLFGEQIIHRIPVEGDYFLYKGKIKVPIKPMIGVIGTAPAGEPVSTMTPMNHGGNMDCTKVEEGSILYLPVFVEGGLLSTGDFHAIMGDGEVGNCGLEIEGRTTLQVDVLKDFPFRYPMIENEAQWITIAYGDTLDEAGDKAVKQMFEFLCAHEQLTKEDAAMLLNMTGDLIVCQIVNPCKTVRVEVPKWLVAEMKN